MMMMRLLLQGCKGRALAGKGRAYTAFCKSQARQRASIYKKCALSEAVKILFFFSPAVNEYVRFTICPDQKRTKF